MTPTWSGRSASDLPTPASGRCLVICSPPMRRCKTGSAPRARRCSMPSRRCCTSATVHRAPSRGSIRHCAPVSTSTRAPPKAFSTCSALGFNLRTRRWGRHKGTSAHQCLTGQRVHDWLTLLGYRPRQRSHSPRALARPHLVGHPDPEHCVPRDGATRMCKDESPDFDRCPPSHECANRSLRPPHSAATPVSSAR